MCENRLMTSGKRWEEGERVFVVVVAAEQQVGGGRVLV